MRAGAIIADNRCHPRQRARVRHLEDRTVVPRPRGGRPVEISIRPARQRANRPLAHGGRKAGQQRHPDAAQTRLLPPRTAKLEDRPLPLRPTRIARPVENARRSFEQGTPRVRAHRPGHAHQRHQSVHRIVAEDQPRTFRSPVVRHAVENPVRPQRQRRPRHRPVRPGEVRQLLDPPLRRHSEDRPPVHRPSFARHPVKHSVRPDRQPTRRRASVPPVEISHLHDAPRRIHPEDRPIPPRPAQRRRPINPQRCRAHQRTLRHAPIRPREISQHLRLPRPLHPESRARARFSARCRRPVHPPVPALEQRRHRLLSHQAQRGQRLQCREIRHHARALRPVPEKRPHLAIRIHHRAPRPHRQRPQHREFPAIRRQRPLDDEIPRDDELPPQRPPLADHQRIAPIPVDRQRWCGKSQRRTCRGPAGIGRPHPEGVIRIQRQLRQRRAHHLRAIPIAERLPRRGLIQRPTHAPVKGIGRRRAIPFHQRIENRRGKADGGSRERRHRGWHRRQSHKGLDGSTHRSKRIARPQPEVIGRRQRKTGHWQRKRNLRAAGTNVRRHG